MPAPNTAGGPGDAGSTAFTRAPYLLVDRIGVMVSAGVGVNRSRPLSLPQLDLLLAIAAADPSAAALAGSDGAATLLAHLERQRMLGGSGPVAPTEVRAEHDSWEPSGDPSEARQLITPFVLRVSAAGFEHLDHEGRVLEVFGPAEILAALAFGGSSAIDVACDGQAMILGDRGLPPEHFDRLVTRLERARLLARTGPDGEDTTDAKNRKALQAAFGSLAERQAHADTWISEWRERELEVRGEAARHRTRVVPVTDGGCPVLSLGLLMAHAGTIDGGALNDHYEFVPDWMNRTVPSLTGDEDPAIFLFSDYIWSHRWNLRTSRQIKEIDPRHLVIHGGPDTPRYPEDVRTYLEANPHVDIAVHGEGEVTFAELLAALVDARSDDGFDLSVLKDVPGLTARVGQQLVRTENRDRIADLDEIPSPFISGVFDSVGTSGFTLVVMESNRGCPYGCTYCDWGSATLSRIRKFDLDRVYRELEWIAQHRVEIVFNADANFGVFNRDVDIARRVVELKQQYGFPKVFGMNFAKNTVKHLREIVEILKSGGILTTGTLSMQSADEQTLLTIRRQNIKVDRYNDLADEFAKNNLPLVAELMMGLPGSTKESFTQDLQQCIDREMRARVYSTELLVNSPMNEPAYREEHQIETIVPISETWTADEERKSPPFVVATATFTRKDYAQMVKIREHFLMLENFGVLRHVGRFVRQETGLTEMAVYSKMARLASKHPDRWPTLDLVFEELPHHMITPASWRLFIDEVHDVLVRRFDVADDSALDTVLRVQHHLLPARDRSFPARIELAHDFVAWHRALVDHKLGETGPDWVTAAPRLITYGPGTLDVDDPQAVSTTAMGEPVMANVEADWELESPVSRTVNHIRLGGSLLPAPA